MKKLKTSELSALKGGSCEEPWEPTMPPYPGAPLWDPLFPPGSWWPLPNPFCY